jgi:glycosyltransferase involved in cell wall biosynthesis
VTHHVVVPYAASNSTVRTRALHWIERCDRDGVVAADEVVVHGPGFAGGPVEPGATVLLVRNRRRLTRGRSEQRLLARAGVGVYDVDDGLPWDDGNLPGLGRWWKRPFPRSLVASRAASAADRVIAGNDTLAEWASEWCADVRIVPTCIEPHEYEPRSSWEIDGRVPTIGWIGSHATEGYLDDIAPSLVEVNRRTGARVEIVSGPGDVPELLAPFTSRTEWTPASTRAISAWDVGIMPLRDGVYERAKCGYKLLQYAASGVPAVGSPVGVNAEMLAEMDGFAPNASEWVDALIEAIGESADRRAQRARAGLVVSARYSYDAWQPAWVDAVGWTAT